MPSHSVKQAKVMSAIAHGWKPKGSVAKIPLKVAKDFHAADKGHKYGKGMHKGDTGRHIARKRASGGKTRFSDFRKSDDIEDRRAEPHHRPIVNRPPPEAAEPGPIPQPSQISDSLGALTLEREMDEKGVQYADGGATEDEKDTAAMMPETYANPLVKNAISGLANLPQQAIEASAEDVQHLGEPGYEKQSIAPAAQTALSMVGGAGIVPAEANALRTGVGLRSMTANFNNYDKFKAMEAAGAKPNQIYTNTGWYRGEDRVPRYWIDDSGASLKDENLFHYYDQHGNHKTSITDPESFENDAPRALSEIWDHPKLYEAHPWLKDLPVVQHPTKEVKAYYDPLNPSIHIGDAAPDELHDSLHHEVVHAIQHEEGFSNGSNPRHFLPPEFPTMLEKAQDKFTPIGNVLESHGTPVWGMNIDQMNKIAFRNRKDLNPFEQEIRAKIRSVGLWDQFTGSVKDLSAVQRASDRAYQQYLNVAGESEARDAPFIRANPGSLKPWQIPMHVNPELKGRKFNFGQDFSQSVPRPSARFGDEEFPEDFIPDGVYEKHKDGGTVAKKDKDPEEHEYINFKKGGLIDSGVPGRTDKIPMKVPPGSYVLPADIPSALGQGNTKAGSEILKKMFTHSAYGLEPLKTKGKEFHYPHSIAHKHKDGGKVEAEKALPEDHQLGMKVPKGGSMCANCKYLASPTTCGNKGFVEWNKGPKLPEPADEYCCDNYGIASPKGKAEGGEADDAKIITAGGEYIIHPDDVKAVGHGDMGKGHKVLDKFVLHTRKQHIKTLKGLKGPKK